MHTGACVVLSAGLGALWACSGANPSLGGGASGASGSAFASGSVVAAASDSAGASGAAGSVSSDPAGASGAAVSAAGSAASDPSGASGAAGGAQDASPSSNSGGPVLYGSPYEGGVYNLGPVDWAETQFHNACAPAGGYLPSIQQAEGTLLAGLWGGVANVASFCDACIAVQTAAGKSAVLRVVTYGETTANSIDLSPEAYAALSSGEYPRAMTWTFAECPETGSVTYEFQTLSSEWWTSLWVRNARVPLTKVEVQSANHPSYIELTRASDGTLTDGAGFGKGAFSIRSTGVDGQTIVDTFSWPSGGVAGQVLVGTASFR